MLLLMAGVISMAGLIMLRWYYCRNLNWQIKVLTASLKNKISAKQQNTQVVQQLLKKIYVLIHKSMAVDDSIAVYQSLDLLKLAFGYGLVRGRESSNLMGICVVALHNKKPDTVSFVLDVFRPLLRQLPPEEVISAVDQLTIIGVMALKGKYNFLAAKVVECIFFIMEQTQGTVDPKIIVASLKALKVIGVLGLRRRDMELFREINRRLSGARASLVNQNVADEIGKMLSAWLYRIAGLNDLSLFVVITDLTRSLIQDKAIAGDGFDLLIDEWGDVAATACLNPNSPMAGLIIEFLFQVVSAPLLHKQWIKTLVIAGRVGKLAMDRHGLILSFQALHPMLEVGRNLLRMELKFLEYIDEIQQQYLFRVIRECLSILNYGAKQNILGSTGETIIELFTYWVSCSGHGGNHQSIKKYCQLLLLFWLKNKRQSKRYMPPNINCIEPMLFSEKEKLRLGL